MYLPGFMTVIIAFVLGVFFALGMEDSFSSSHTSGVTAGVSIVLAIALLILASIYLRLA